LTAKGAILSKMCKNFYTLSTTVRNQILSNQGGEVMNKKLVVAVALIFGAAGLILAQGTVKAQDATENSVTNTTTTTTTTSDNSDAGAAMNTDNTAPEAAANAAQ
jgi:hypothetical protein